MITILCLVVVLYHLTDCIEDVWTSRSDRFISEGPGYALNLTSKNVVDRDTIHHCLSVCHSDEFCMALNIEQVIASDTCRCHLFTLADLSKRFNSDGWEMKDNFRFYSKIPSSCFGYRISGHSANGIYEISIDGNKTFPLWCDMADEGGGWDVLLRREDGDVSFERTWEEYKIGFGTLSSTYWLGNDHIHQLTSKHPTEVKIDLVDEDNNKYRVKYDNFQVFDETNNYQLNLGTYMTDESNALDCLTHECTNSNCEFSTSDRDNDNYGTACSSTFGGNGGWWFNACAYSQMTGRFMGLAIHGNMWCHPSYHHENAFKVKYSVLKVRRKLPNLSVQKPGNGTASGIATSLENANNGLYKGNKEVCTYVSNQYVSGRHWWQVDIQNTAILIFFKFYRRLDKQTQSEEIYVDTKQYEDSPYKHCFYIPIGLTENPYKFSCIEKHTIGRYIRLQKSLNAVDMRIAIDEFEAFGYYI